MRWRIARRRPLALALALALAGCADDAAAPARTCSHHDQCDDDYLCGPKSVCVAAAPCEHDTDCCPGALCFSGWCRPTVTCDEVAGRPCEGLGQSCERGQCVPAPCADDAACPGPTRCFAGRCVSGPPCDDRCGAGELCDVPSGRCLLANEPPSCDQGARLVLASGYLPEPLTCDGFAWPGVCAELPTVPLGQPGVDGRLVALPTGPAIVSYDPVYGDLVLSRFDLAGGGTRADVALDGVPARAPEGTLRGYRGGVLDVGPDRGARPSVLTTDRGELDIVYRDLDDGGLRQLRVDPTSLAVSARSRLPIDGDVGRWSCLARHATAAGERLAGLAFVAVDASGQSSGLVAFEANVDVPAGPGDWTTRSVLTTPLPPRAASPCGGACGRAAVCVRPAGQPDTCGGAVGLDSCPAACGRHEVCVRLEDAAPSCQARVYPTYDADRLPFGAGLFATCARGGDGELVAAWYDHDARALMAGRWPFDAPATVVDAAAGADLGRHARLAAAADGHVIIAYRDETAGALRFAEAPNVTGPWTRTVIDADPDGALDLGAWPDLRVDSAGAPIVAYGEATRGDVRVARRGAAGCWAVATALSGGGFAWPGVLDAGAGELDVSALAFRFTPALRPEHAPILIRVPAPLACE